MTAISRAFGWASDLLPRDWRDRFFELVPQDTMVAELIEAILSAEADHHIEQELIANRASHRNGYFRRTVRSDDGAAITVRVPRVRGSRFEPLLIAYHRQSLRYGSFDRIRTMYARGLQAGETDEMLLETYNYRLPPDLLPRITDAASRVVRGRQARRLLASYSVVVFGMLPTTTLERRRTQPRPVFFALALLPDGSRDLLGLCVDDGSGDNLWIQLIADLAARGTAHISLAVIDEVAGAPPLPINEIGPEGHEHCKVELVCHIDELFGKSKSADQSKAIETATTSVG